MTEREIRQTLDQARTELDEIRARLRRGVKNATVSAVLGASLALSGCSSDKQTPVPDGGKADAGVIDSAGSQADSVADLQRKIERGVMPPYAAPYQAPDAEPLYKSLAS